MALALATDGLSPIADLQVELLDVLVQCCNGCKGLFNRRRVPAFALPPSDAFTLGFPLAELGVDLLAVLALVWLWGRGINELHTTCFSHAVFLVAVLAEVTPLPITTSETVLLVEAHCSIKSLERWVAVGVG